MKPRTQFEKEAMRLQGKLPAMSYAQLNWVAGQNYENTLDEYAVKGSKVSCYNYFSIVTTFKGYQIVRYVLVHSEMSRNGYKFCFISEVSQRWMRFKEGHLFLAVFEKQYAMNGTYHVHPYCLSSSLALKSWSSSYRRAGITQTCLADSEVYPQRRFTQEFIDARLEKYLGRYDEIWLFEDVRDNKMNNSKVSSVSLDKTEVKPFTKKGYLPTPIETCLKIGETELAYSMLRYDELHAQYLAKYWQSFVIARRHGIKNLSLADWKMWLEYVRDLDEVGKDIRSPKYLCPDDIGMAHAKIFPKAFEVRMARYEEKERIRRARRMQRDEAFRLKEEEIAERKRRAEEREEKNYRKRCGMYFGLAIVTDSGITITPLQSIGAFKEEGDAMHHCVYANEYYKKASCLIFSARDKDGKRVETIEINLNNYKVEQSRGVCNSSTRFHKEIVKAMEEAMGQIRDIRECYMRKRISAVRKAA